MMWHTEKPIPANAVAAKSLNAMIGKSGVESSEGTSVFGGPFQSHP